jgi:predicted amidohydrolase YtcJ
MTMAILPEQNSAVLLRLGMLFTILHVSFIQHVRATTVLYNAKIYTVSAAKPWAEAIAFDENENGRILAVGTTAEVQAAFPDAATMTDLAGKFVMPGFIDAHLHAVEAGIYELTCEIPPLTSVAKIPLLLKDCEDQGMFGSEGWIVGAGIDIGSLEEQLFDSTKMEYPIDILDKSYPDTPVLILDSLGHGALANTAALQAVGYLDITDDPPGGILRRDFDTGELIGIVLENGQQRLRDAAFPPDNQDNQDTAYNGLLSSLATLNENGITTVSDAGGFWRQAQVEAWDRVLQDGKLTVRASNALYIYPDELPFETQQLPQLLQRYSNDPSSLLQMNQAKIYVDGILDLFTSALYDPYDANLELPAEEQNGFEYFANSNITLNQVVQLLVDTGFAIHFHATGDRGAGLALDAIEALTATGTSTGPMHRITHCYLVDERDWNRFAQLNVVADFQLAPSSVDLEYEEFLADVLIGSERANLLLPATELYEAGALLTLSSDWDADELSPLVKLQIVLTRPNGRSFDSLEDVIPMLTINAATLLGLDAVTGSLEVGKSADLVALNQNIFDLDFNDIASTTCVEMTMLQGKVVYQSDGGSCNPPDTSSSVTSNGGSSNGGGSSAVACFWWYSSVKRCYYFVPMAIALSVAFTL